MTQAPVAMTWPDTIAAIERMPLSAATIRRAIAFCRDKIADGTRPPDVVRATDGGTVYMEWKKLAEYNCLYMEAEAMPRKVEIRLVHRSTQ